MTKSQDPYYPDDSFYCEDCYDCTELRCDSHPRNEWTPSPEAYISKFCYSSFGAYNVESEWCVFECALRKACEEATKVEVTEVEG